ncbi:TPA: tetratricopeptide repeat protein [Candidatus Poribacteria bacterium]|nr:tetratricopeptide repeat protein [Candidatus Poribacteria bacterium]HEX29132.1 tetratricopeptide repeat protein [Candidatus Poribacteria bacterium]
MRGRPAIRLAVMMCIALIGCGGERDAFERSQRDIDRGWAYYSVGDMSSALMSFERATSVDLPPGDAYNGLGWVYLSSSEEVGGNDQLISQAVGAFQQAVRIDMENSDAWVGLALSLFLRRSDEDDLKSAIEAIDQAMKNEKLLYRHDYTSKADLWALRGLCNFYLQKVDLALEDLRKALRIDPRNETALRLLYLIDRTKRELRLKRLFGVPGRR